jgi:hypothetical protein
MLTILANNYVTRDDKHDCEPDFIANEIEVQFGKCIERVTTDLTTPIPSVFRETVEELKDKGMDIITKIPKYKNISNKLYRKRNKSLGGFLNQ